MSLNLVSGLGLKSDCVLGNIYAEMEQRVLKSSQTVKQHFICSSVGIIILLIDWFIGYQSALKGQRAQTVKLEYILFINLIIMFFWANHYHHHKPKKAPLDSALCIWTV